MKMWGGALFALLWLPGVLCFIREYNGEDHMVEWQKGETGTKIIIGAPHGGYFESPFLPDRHDGCKVDGACIWNSDCTPRTTDCDAKTSTDQYTQEIAIGLAEELYTLQGVRPHVILSNLHRIKLDPNREEYEATLNNTDTKVYYDEFHDFIDQASTAVGTGVYMDIHAHTHSEAWVEVGYQITKARLDSADWTDTSYGPRKEYSAIRNLATEYNTAHGGSSTAWLDLINGTISFGYYLREELKLSSDSVVSGTAVVPSHETHNPNGGNYYSGGYDIKTHGSKSGGTIDGIQIESPSELRNTEHGPEYIKRLAAALQDFVDQHY